MPRCLTVTFILSGVLLAGVGYFFYDPLPSHLDNVFQLRMDIAKFKASFIYAEIRYRLGYTERYEGIREAVRGFTAPLAEEDKEKLEIYDKKVNGVPVRIYKPKTSTGLLPGLVFYHGGGWSIYDVPSYDGICGHIAQKSNIIVVSVEYRLAPEHPFPAGFEDCVQATLYALKEGNQIGIDTSRVAIAGDSAGGNLAAAVSTKLRDDKVKPPLKAQLLMYGLYQFCDLALPSWKIQETYNPSQIHIFVSYLKMYFNLTQSQIDLLTSRKFLTKDHQGKCNKFVDYKLLQKNLIPADFQPTNQLANVVNDDVKILNSILLDPRLSPMMTEDLSKLPSTFVLSVDWDIFRDENIIYAERLKQAGNKVYLLYLPDSFHGIINKFSKSNGYANGPKLMNEIDVFINKYLK